MIHSDRALHASIHARESFSLFQSHRYLYHTYNIFYQSMLNSSATCSVLSVKIEHYDQKQPSCLVKAYPYNTHSTPFPRNPLAHHFSKTIFTFSTLPHTLPCFISDNFGFISRFCDFEIGSKSVLVLLWQIIPPLFYLFLCCILIHLVFAPRPLDGLQCSYSII